ncbi:hypothetical protein Ahy_A06g030046 isoform A [Arachis hypogaea]|uniref:Trichome birefringence-like C-terminal domain-containing protein n=1 Tax=Arachis hypogaea TaxID=3818 RepID=A0A445CV32_ARAHY|nr:hypothetical protein Ahy_A06g030046 isoform A [Arachis hypogaea]
MKAAKSWNKDVLDNMAHKKVRISSLAKWYFGTYSARILNNTNIKKLAWRLIHDKETLWIRILRIKYGSGDTLVLVVQLDSGLTTSCLAFISLLILFGIVYQRIATKAPKASFGDDQVAWLHSMNGSFSVKSAYSIYLEIPKNLGATLVLKEETPKDIHKDSEDRYRTWYFPKHDFTLMMLWSRFIIVGEEQMINGSASGTFDLQLDKVDDDWARELPNLDYAIISGGHWFFRVMYLHEGDNLVGCVYCGQPNVTSYNSDFPLRKAFRTAFNYINNGCKECGKLVTVLRTFAPAHFENGAWNTGGYCNRTGPASESEVDPGMFEWQVRNAQMEEFEKARKEGMEKGQSFEVLDVTVAMMMRPDGHPGDHWGNKWMRGYNDCTHWCLPGPVDLWSELLLAILNKRTNLSPLGGGVISTASKGEDSARHKVKNVDIWRSACLAHLYRALCRASRVDCKKIDGPLTFLLDWAWIRLLYLSPVPREPRSFSLANRWRNWKHDRVDPNIIPAEIYMHSVVWSATVPLVSFECIEWHATDRYRRQFRFVQGVPHEDRNLDKAHGEVLTGGPKNINWATAPTHYSWTNRHHHVLSELPMPSQHPLDTYMHWYRGKFGNRLNLSNLVGEENDEGNQDLDEGNQDMDDDNKEQEPHSPQIPHPNPLP